MTANNTINNFGGLDQFFGYREVDFTFYDDTNPFFTYDEFLDDLTTNNYWDGDTDYDSADVNGYYLYMINIIQKYLIIIRII